ncbi:13070_t:CDS:2 [Rhizophagus irregularis]|nr:13070_t:CDS:2 [Rhizophagus irregularis]
MPILARYFLRKTTSMKFPTKFSKETKKQVTLWGEIIRNKHKDDGLSQIITTLDIFLDTSSQESENDEFYIKIYEYNQPVLISRNIIMRVNLQKTLLNGRTTRRRYMTKQTHKHRN